MFVALGIFSNLAVADDDFSKEVVKATTLTTNLYMLEGAGGNMTALLSSEGTLLVNDDFAPMAGKIVAKLKELGGDSPRYIVNTHFHYDHTGGNEVFGNTATIIAAPALRTRLRTRQTLWKKQFPPQPPQSWPRFTYKKSLTLHLGGESVRLLHFENAHTDGDTVVFFQNAKVVSMGDLYFSGMYPIFHPEHDGGLTGYIRAIEQVLHLISEDTKIVAGHGPLSGRKDLVLYHKMLLASVATVKSAIGKGHSLEQIQKAGLAKEWEIFGHGYLSTERWLALVYQDLSKH